MKKYITINGNPVEVVKETLFQKYFNWVMKGLEIKGERK
jgi:hypothetical protein